jgi:hypothetical protein
MRLGVGRNCGNDELADLNVVGGFLEEDEAHGCGGLGVWISMLW